MQHGETKAPFTPATMSKQRSTLLPKTTTMSCEFVVKFRLFDKVECCFDIFAVFGNNVERNFVFSFSRNSKHLRNQFHVNCFLHAKTPAVTFPTSDQTPSLSHQQYEWWMGMTWLMIMVIRTLHVTRPCRPPRLNDPYLCNIRRDVTLSLRACAVWYHFHIRYVIRPTCGTFRGFHWFRSFLMFCHCMFIV